MIAFNGFSVFHFVIVQFQLNAFLCIGHLVCFLFSTMKDCAAVNHSGYKYIFTSVKLFPEINS